MHEDNKAKGRSMLPVSRRRFVQGLAAGGAVAALDWRAGWAFAEPGQQQPLATLTGTRVLSHQPRVKYAAAARFTPTSPASQL
jgi:hypothetical protein